jgi:ABC-type polysaccharide/polyol phosphate transport system ATPase subunit
MYLRLGFAIAAHLDPDILLLDKVLAVSGVAFIGNALTELRGCEKRAGQLSWSRTIWQPSSACATVPYY